MFNRQRLESNAQHRLVSGKRGAFVALVLLSGCSLIRINGKTWDEIQAEKNGGSASGASGGRNGSAGSGSGSASAETRLAEATKATEKFESLAKQKPDKLPTEVDPAKEQVSEFAHDFEVVSELIYKYSRRPEGARMHGKTRADGSTEDAQSTSSDFIDSKTAIALVQRAQRAYEPIMSRWIRGQLAAGHSYDAFTTLLTVFDADVDTPATGRYGKEHIATSGPVDTLKEVQDAWRKVYKKETAGTVGYAGMCLAATSPWNGKAHNPTASLMVVGDPVQIYVRCAIDPDIYNKCANRDTPKASIHVEAGGRAHLNFAEVGKKSVLEYTFTATSASLPENTLEAKVHDFKTIKMWAECSYVKKRYRDGTVDKSEWYLAEGHLIWLRDANLWPQ